MTLLRNVFSISNDLGPYWAWATQGIEESIRKTMNADTQARLLDQDFRTMEMEDLQEFLETR